MTDVRENLGWLLLPVNSVQIPLYVKVSFKLADNRLPIEKWKE